MTNQSTDWIQAEQNEINQSLQKLFDTYPNNKLKEAMTYAVLNGGKRIRSLLIKSIGSFYVDDKNILNKLSIAIELIHAYSLIHDDLPAMDNDNLRRGLPTCHIKYGEPQAILAGDALQTLAFDLLASEEFKVDEKKKVKIISFLSNAIGLNGMVLGQSQDMLFTDQKINIDQLNEMQLLKTGKLFEASCVCPYLLSDNTDDLKFHDYQKLGTLIGRMYQITDDILDTTIDTNQLGKTKGKDSDANKQTYVTIFGIKESKRMNASIYEEINSLIVKFGNKTSKLSSLIDFIYKREF